MLISANEAKQMTDKAQQTYKELFDDYFNETLAPIINQKIHSATAQGYNSTTFGAPRPDTIPCDIFKTNIKKTLESFGYDVWAHDNLGYYSGDSNTVLYSYTIFWIPIREEI